MSACIHEPNYKPRTKRLLPQIDELEGLLAMPEARVTQAPKPVSVSPDPCAFFLCLPTLRPGALFLRAVQ